MALEGGRNCGVKVQPPGGGRWGMSRCRLMSCEQRDHFNSIDNAGRRFSSWPQCRTAHGGDIKSRRPQKSMVHLAGGIIEGRPGFWACGSSPRNGVIIIIIMIEVEAAQSERGTDDQLDKAETQPCQRTVPHCTGLGLPAACTHTVHSEEGRRQLEVRARTCRGPAAAPTDLVSPSGGAALHKRAAALPWVAWVAWENSRHVSHVKAAWPRTRRKQGA